MQKTKQYIETKDPDIPQIEAYIFWHEGEIRRNRWREDRDSRRSEESSEFEDYEPPVIIDDDEFVDTPPDDDDTTDSPPADDMTGAPPVDEDDEMPLLPIESGGSAELPADGGLTGDTPA